MKPLRRLVSLLRRQALPGEPVRRWVRRLLVILAVVIVAPTIMPGRAVGQAHVDKGGSVGISSQVERDLFFSLICMCGCPRETLGTCTCGYAGERRDELREMIGQGMTLQAIQKAYAARFGTQSLAVPPSEGMGALIWAFPLLAFVAGAFMVVRLLRRWTAKGSANAKTADAAVAERKTANKDAGPDAYDDKLDAELKELDRE
ncbi:MAG: cytochrome c-type biogenesis protein CcmH [Polyangiaceae bacterium]|jgi:cytochrome c-type biogenesis protein CcmH|nr:cytochrome c-type biogenesis protein CcmH [Polyangiaceae bacterium]MBK8938342.1 cytochrome c-type biogenesis protein CcmH [Polyangiaceae bacterium]